MSSHEERAVTRPADAMPESDVFGKPNGPIRPDLQNPDAPATAPSDQHEENQPDRTLSRKTKRHRDREKALLKDALKADRKLKRGHRAYWKADPKAFRAILKKSRARVFHLKPGPKKDPRKNAQIAEAARKHAGGAEWQQLYPDYIEHHAQMSEYTRHYAEAGFQKEVNRYLRKHPRLRRKFSKKTVPTQSTP